MTRSSRLRLTIALLTVAVGTAAYAGLARTKLIVNGSVASTSVREIDGRAYVPLADVANALGFEVATRSDAYELTRPGGANQVEGQHGKIGDVVFNGKWRFQVVSIAPADSYTMQNKCTNDYSVYNTTAEFDPTSGVFRPKPGNTLYVVKCVLKNGLRTNQSLWRPNSETHTAVTDDQGQAYPPIGYDLPESGPFESKAVLPGAALPVAIVFTVPSGTTPKDLIFALRTISDKGSEVRISLTPAPQ